MRNDDLSADQHKVIYAHTSPLSPALVAANTQLRTHLPGLVQKQPDMLALLDLAFSAGNICAIVEDKRDDKVCRLDRFLHDQKFLAQLLALLRLPQ